MKGEGGKQRVLHVIADLGAGGVQSSLARSLPRLMAGPFEHELCVLSAGGPYEAPIRALGVPLHRLRRRGRFDPTLPAQAARLMRERKIDIVHTLAFTANAWGRVAARMARVPRVIAHERGTAWTESAAMRLVDRLLYPTTDLWLANSDAALIVLRERVGLPGAKLRRLYNGIPAAGDERGALRALLGLRDEVPLVGAVGRLDTPKGYSTLLRALPALWAARPDTHVAIIGDGPLRPALHAEAARLGIAADERLHWLGFRADAPALVADLDLLLHPALREALGNVLIEAALAGVAAIASDVDGCPEVVSDGETGLLLRGTLPPDPAPRGSTPLPALVVDGATRTLRPPLALEPSALAAAALTLLDDPARRAAMGAAARRRAAARFSMAQYVAGLEAAYAGGEAP